MPPAIPEPDRKDWTFVLREPCQECGFDPASVTPEGLPELLRVVGGRFSRAVEREGAMERPAPEVWSAIEYGRHTADVADLMTGRLELMLEAAEAGEGPVRFEKWDADAVAVEEEYWRANSHATALLLTERSEAAAEAWAAVAAERWEARGLRGDGAEFTAWTLGLYLAHEFVHHLHDVKG